MPANLIKMKNKKSSRFQLTIILVQNPKTKSYTAYFKQIPDIITEGNNEKEAIRNIFKAVSDVVSYQDEIKNITVGKDLKILKKSIKADRVTYNIEVYKLPFTKNDKP